MRMGDFTCYWSGAAITYISAQLVAMLMYLDSLLRRNNLINTGAKPPPCCLFSPGNLLMRISPCQFNRGDVFDQLGNSVGRLGSEAALASSTVVSLAQGSEN
jgi:hypothetical protein